MDLCEGLEGKKFMELDRSSVDNVEYRCSCTDKRRKAEWEVTGS